MSREIVGNFSFFLLSYIFSVLKFLAQGRQVTTDMMQTDLAIYHGLPHRKQWKHPQQGISQEEEATVEKSHRASQPSFIQVSPIWGKSNKERICVYKINKLRNRKGDYLHLQKFTSLLKYSCLRCLKICSFVQRFSKLFVHQNRH